MTIIQAVLATLAFLCILLLATALDVIIWRKKLGTLAPWINLLSLGSLSVAFFLAMKDATGIQPGFTPITLVDLLFSVVSSLVLFLLLDRGLDPLLEKRFPGSEAKYQEALVTLRKSPYASSIHVVLLGPAVEELLMRGFILNGLLETQGVCGALILSSVLFALLHFNMVQTLSAVIAGLVLGILYLYTGSVFSTLITHSLYNFLSYYRSPPRTDLKTSRSDASWE